MFDTKMYISPKLDSNQNLIDVSEIDTMTGVSYQTLTN